MQKSAVGQTKKVITWGKRYVRNRQGFIQVKDFLHWIQRSVYTGNTVYLTFHYIVKKKPVVIFWYQSSNPSNFLTC